MIESSQVDPTDVPGISQDPTVAPGATIPPFLIKIDEKYVFIVSKFEFEKFGKEHFMWFRGSADPIRPSLPKINESIDFETVSIKMLSLLKRYKEELYQYFPNGMNGTTKRNFAAALVSKIPLFRNFIY
ncbi:hypothetical protein BLOT_002239 [Blomia tropicalis]|nr:hypothetical protein BLOT_002239 [Blomia tropicalis]